MKISTIHNFFKFNRCTDIMYNFVLRAIQRHKNTGDASDTPRNVKKSKIDDDVLKSVIKRATVKKKPKYQRSTRKISKIMHGSPGKKRKISRASVQNILKNFGKRYKRPKRVHILQTSVKSGLLKTLLFLARSHLRLVIPKDANASLPKVFCSLYMHQKYPCELYNNYIQQELDNFAQRQGYPKSIKNLKSRIHRIVRKTPKSYFKNVMAGMPGRIRKCTRLMVANECIKDFCSSLYVCFLM